MKPKGKTDYDLALAGASATKLAYSNAEHPARRLLETFDNDPTSAKDKAAHKESLQLLLKNMEGSS